MSTLKFANNAASLVASNITASATSVSVTAGSGALFPTLAVGEVFLLTFIDFATKSLTEIVLVTARSGDILTIVRAQESTSARAWASGDYASNYMTAHTLDSYVQVAALQIDRPNYAYDVGAVNAMVVNLAPAPVSLASIEGAPIRVRVAHANTGPITLNLNGLGAFPVQRGGGVNLPPNALQISNTYQLTWNGGYFEITSSHDNNINDLDTGVALLNSEVETLTSQVAGLSTQVGTLGGEVSTLFNSFLRTLLFVPGSATTFTAPAMVYAMKIRAQGGGGGGGGSVANYGAGGGGAGGHAVTHIACNPGDVVSWLVYAGGAAGGPGAAGGTAQSTSVYLNGTLVARAAGGQGGIQGASGVPPAGGSPGGADIGDLQLGGGYGGDGLGNPGAGVMLGGLGGGSRIGGGGRGANGGGGPANGIALGSGGGGSYGNANATGGLGASGCVIIEY